MKRTIRSLSFLLLPLIVEAPVGTAYGADLDDFISAPGMIWGVLIDTNAVANSVAVIPDGFAVAGTGYAEHPELPGIDTWAVLAQLDTNGVAGVVARYDSETEQNEARDIWPIVSGGTTLDGFVFAGSRHRRDPDPIDPGTIWQVPWAWVVRTDAAFDRTWEQELGTVTHWTEAHVVIGEPLGFLVGASDYHAPGVSTSASEWAVRLTKGGAAGAGETFSTDEFGGLYDIVLSSRGGFAFATTRGIVGANSALEFEWRIEDVAEEPDCGRDGYHGIARTADDLHYYAAGSRAGPDDLHDLVVTKLANDGTRAWRRVFGAAGKADVGLDVAATADGGCIAVGSTSAGRHGGIDLWALKLEADGTLEWDITLGGPGLDDGRSVVVAPDGHYVVAGSAEVDGVDRMWVVKIDSDLYAPVPVITVDPSPPLFRDQEARFDSRDSLAPGSPIASREWRMGDGTTLSGDYVDYAYHDKGVHELILTLTNTDGISRSATNEVEVTALAVQWERRLGYGSGTRVNSMVEAVEEDGSVVVTGMAGDALWLFKTTPRGRADWEQFYPGVNCEIEGQSVIATADGGYAVGGRAWCYDGGWDQDALLMKYDANGLPTPAWPDPRLFGDPGAYERAWCVAAAHDGGYILVAEKPPPGGGTSAGVPWLIKTHADGSLEWERDYETDHYLVANWVTPITGGGYAFTAAAASESPCVITTAPDGAETGRTDLGKYNTVKWIGERDNAGTGFAVVGEMDNDISLVFLDGMGAPVDTNTWTGTGSRDLTDVGNHAARTVDGGYLLTGNAMPIIPGTSAANGELALVKTDAAGHGHWIDFFPGTTNRQEEGVASVALADGSYIVLGRISSGGGDQPVWLFKLAANRPPVARMEIDPEVTIVGTDVSFDGRPSTDVEGDVVLFEWDFGDGNTNEDAQVTHQFAASGVYEVFLTAVDEEGAEGTTNGLVTVAGAKSLDPTFTIHDFTVSECAACEPENYPPAGAPADLDWETARGFRIVASAGTSSSRAIQATFSEPLPDDFTLYLLPTWEPIAFTLVNEYTIEVDFYIHYGEVDFAFVYAGSVVHPSIAAVVPAPGPRLALTFHALDGWVYTIEHSQELAPASWAAVSHALTPTDPVVLDTIVGADADATIYVELPPDVTGFFRIGMTPE